MERNPRMARKLHFIVLAFGLSCALAACAARPENMMLPVAATAPGASKVDILVATTRRADASNGALFSGERSRLTFANIVVSIPPDSVRKIGDVQWPQTSPGNPATDFVTLRADRLDAPQARSWIGVQVKATPKHRVLVFVHGFNTRFDDTIFNF